MKKLVLILSVALFLNFNYSSAREISQADMQRYSAYYSNGIQYMKNQQFSSAITEFKKVLRFSPYDKTTQNALFNAYYARAEYYRTQTKEIKKALTDYKSAYFYARYWQDGAIDSAFVSSSLRQINDFEKRLQTAQTTDSRLQSAKILKAQGELAAAGYDFQQLKNTNYKETAYENLGNIYKNLNNLAYAMDYFKTAIDINPKNPKLHFLYGVMLDEAQNYDASMEQYNLALQYGDNSPELLEILENKWTQNLVNNPSDSQSYVNLGAIYQKQKNYTAAKNQYMKALNLNPNDETILYNLASLYVEQNNLTDAIAVYNELLIKKPNNLEVLEYKANAYEKMGKYDDTLSVLEKMASIEPNNAEIKNRIDDIVLNHFDGAKLQNYIAKTAKNNPTNYEAQFNYALDLHKNKNYPLAIEYYSKAMALNPTKEETYLNLTQIYIEQKNFDKAQEICNKGLMVLPNSSSLKNYLSDIKNYNSNAQYELATKLFEQKNYSGAIKEYLKIQNQTTEVKSAIASCYWQMNDFNNANKYYLDILKTEPNNLEYLTASAWAYYSLNDYNSAKQTANRILALDKTNADAKNIISNIDESQSASLLQEGINKYENSDFSGALTTFNNLLNKDANNEYGIYYKALTLDELKKPTESIKQYKLLISKNPNFAEAYYSLALAFDNLENYKEAVTYYEKFVSLKQGQNDEMTKFSVNRIKELKEYLASLKK